MHLVIQVCIVSLVCGIFGTATRNAMDIVKVSSHPKFLDLPFWKRKWVVRHLPFAYRRHLIGVVTAFVATVTLGLELDVLHQAVIALIASLSGSSFLTKHMEESGSNGELLKHLQDAVDFELQSLAAELEFEKSEAEVAVTQVGISD